MIALFVIFFNNNSELLFQCCNFTEIREKKTSPQKIFILSFMFFYFVSVIIVGIAEGESLLWFRPEIIDVSVVKDSQYQSCWFMVKVNIVLPALSFQLNVM